MIAPFALALLILAGADQPAAAPKVDVTDYGIYSADVVLNGDWKTGVPVTVQLATNITLSDTATTIPAMPGVNWGLHAQITNPSHDRQILVTCTLTHPAFVTPDGQKHTQEVYEVFQVDPGKTVPEECMWYFVKECPYEFVPGKWSITFDIDGKTVLTKDFHLYKPKPAAGP